MKKIEKDLIFKDLDYINNEYDIKLEKLNSIVSLFMDEEPEIAQEKSEENFKQEEEKVQNIKDEEEKKSEEQTEEQQTTEPNIEESDNQNVTIDLPSDIKTLYRKIVMMTHPDKSKNNKNFDLYSDYYRRTIKAKDENDKAEIIYIAYKLKLGEVYDIDDEHFGSIKKKIKEKEMSSNNLNYNSFWIWYHTDNQVLKQMMAHQINRMGVRK